MAESEEHRTLKERIARQWRETGYEVEVESRHRICGTLLRVDVVAENEDERVAIEVGGLNGGEGRVNLLLNHFTKVVHVPLDGIADEQDYPLRDPSAHDSRPIPTWVMAVLDQTPASVSAACIADKLGISKQKVVPVLGNLVDKNAVQCHTYWLVNEREPEFPKCQRLYSLYENVPREELIRELRRLDRKFEHGVRPLHLKIFPLYPLYVYEREFGSWEAAKKAAGVD